MAATIRYHLDEHVNPAIATGLRLRGVDVTTTPEVALLGASDEDQLAFALFQQRVIVTHDEHFLSLAMRGVQHAGICYCHQESRSIRQVIEMLHLLHECYDAEDIANRVEYL